MNLLFLKKWFDSLFPEQMSLREYNEKLLKWMDEADKKREANSIREENNMTDYVGCGHLEPHLICRIPDCVDCKDKPRRKNVIEQEFNGISCGYADPNLICRFKHCENCKDKPRRKNVIEQGYRPENKLDTSNPPKSGSAVQLVKPSSDITENYSAGPFKLWFSGFKAAIVSYPTGEQWVELCRMIENLKD